ncbi:MAG: hypothetical protein AVDCRST_MAG85-3846, partial [uncultured Solirubrobacteraceae bacterium]
DPEVHHDVARGGRLRRVRAHPAARRTRRRLPQRGCPAHGLRALHGPRDARRLDPRGARSGSRNAPLRRGSPPLAAWALRSWPQRPRPAVARRRAPRRGAPCAGARADRADVRGAPPAPRPRGADEPRSEDVPRARAVQRLGPPEDRRGRRPLARWPDRRRGPQRHRGQRRRDHRRVGALVVPVRGRPRRRGRRRARHRAGHGARRARRGGPRRQRRGRRARRTFARCV